MNFLGLSGKGGGMRELESSLFLFFWTVYFEVIEKEGGWLGSIEFLEGRDGEIVCEVKKMTVGIYLICPRSRRLLLGEELKS